MARSLGAFLFHIVVGLSLSTKRQSAELRASGGCCMDRHFVSYRSHKSRTGDGNPQLMERADQRQQDLDTRHPRQKDALCLSLKLARFESEVRPGIQDPICNHVRFTTRPFEQIDRLFLSPVRGNRQQHREQFSLANTLIFGVNSKGSSSKSICGHRSRRSPSIVTHPVHVRLRPVWEWSHPWFVHKSNHVIQEQPTHIVLC